MVIGGIKLTKNDSIECKIVGVAGRDKYLMEGYVMEYVEFININKELLDSIKPGDLIKINDLKKHLEVIAVSENYFVMARKILSKWEYLICEKKPWKDIRKNSMVYGKFHIGSDGWVFGSPVWKDFGCKDYDFDNFYFYKKCSAYRQDLY